MRLGVFVQTPGRQVGGWRHPEADARTPTSRCCTTSRPPPTIACRAVHRHWPGNVHSADGWKDLLEPFVAKVERHGRYTAFPMAEVAAPAEFLREFGRSRCRNLRSQSSCDSALREHWKDVSICTARGILSGFPPIKRWPQRP